MPSENSGEELQESLSFLSDMVEPNKKGNICVKLSSVTDSLRSRSGWQYRKMEVFDRSITADILIAESKYSEWKFRPGDHLACSAKSNGVDNEGKLSLFFDDFLGPFDTARLLFEATKALYEDRSKASGRMKSSETVYQISAREAKSLMELIKLWMEERKPQHYTKWCQMHQIVATNLFYMGLVKRTASMSGYYYPTQDALEFFAGKRSFPKKKVFARGSGGEHVLVSEDGELRSFTEYLADYADRDSALEEYRDALNANKDKIKAILEQKR
ncbi:MAG: hypothetical protein ACYC7D_11595 [Nitrososphaerales archaeon]